MDRDGGVGGSAGGGAGPSGAQAAPGTPAGTSGLDRLLATLGEGVAVLELVRDPDGRLVDLRYLHAAPLLADAGGPGGTIVGRLISEAIPDLDPWWMEAHATVAETRVPLAVPHAIAELGRWFAITIYPAGPDRIVVVCEDVTAEHEATEAAQASEGHQRYLVTLLDALRPIEDPGEIQEEAARRLGEHLGADRVFYAELETIEGVEHLHVRRGFVADGLPPIAGRFALSSVGGAVMAAASSGRTFAGHDLASDPILSAADRALFARHNIGAYLAVPLVKQGRLVAILAIGRTEPHAWTAHEIAVAEETAERTWAAVERAHAEAALRESELRYSSLFDSMEEAFLEAELVRDAGGRPVDAVYRDVNPAFERLIGLPRAQVLGHHGREFLPPDLDLLDRIAAAVESGATHRFEARVGDRWFDVTVMPRGGADFAMLLDDVTERRHAERLLRETGDRQALLVRLEDSLRPLDDPAAIHRQACRLLAEFLDAGRCVSITVDGPMATVAGQHARTVPAMPSRFPISVLPGSVIDAYRHGQSIAIEDLRTDPRLTVAERGAARASGIGALTAAVLVEDGRWAGALAVHSAAPRAWTPAETAIVNEVAQRAWAASARAEAETALRASETKHRLLFETIGEAFVLAEVLRLPDGRVDVRFLEINQAFERLTTIDRTTLLGRTGREAAPATSEHWYEIAARAAFGREPVRLEYESGDGRWLSTLVTPVGDPGSGQVVMVSSDITERRLAEEQREERLRHEQVAREEAEAASRLREEFLATISHELRTPLAAILLWSRLLGSGRAAGREQEAIETIERNAEVQRVLIEDLLEASRMMAGGVRVDLLVQALGPVVADAAEALRPLADERRIRLEVEVEPGLRTAVDATRFPQVVRNLVDNAIRYTPGGGAVRVGLRRAGTLAELVVTDTGRGITPELLPHVFERFRRGERGGGGLGLGLAIAHELVQLHGGSIEATSGGRGTGATFTVRLPLAPG